MTDPYEDMIASTSANIKRQLANHESFQCLRCRWHSVNASIDEGTCPNFSFYCTCFIRAMADLPQEGECADFEEARQ